MRTIEVTYLDGTVETYRCEVEIHEDNVITLRGDYPTAYSGQRQHIISIPLWAIKHWTYKEGTV